MAVERLKQFKIEFENFSEIGPRTKNEDKIYSEKINNNKYLFMVADGIGGQENGDQAAEIALTTIAKGLQMHENINLQLLTNYFQNAHNKINDQYNDAGTTIGGCYITQSTINIFWAGDVKIYISSCGENYTNKEHTVLNLLRDSHQFVKSEKIRQLQNAVTRAIGGKSNAYSPELITIEREDPFTGLICSDGVHQLFQDSEIFELLNALESKGIIAALKQRASIQSKDNYSAIIFYSE